MKKLFPLVAAYIAGIAVAMKYRQDTGKSKLKTDPNASPVDAFIDEVVDIHKTAFADIKNMVSENLESINNFDDLKARISSLVDWFGSEVDTKIAALKAQGDAKKEDALALVDKTYHEHEATIEAAREKALSFSDTAHDTISDWLTEARKKLNASHKKIKTKLEKTAPKK